MNSAGEWQLPSKRLTGQARPGRTGLCAQADGHVIVLQTENQNNNGESNHEKHNIFGSKKNEDKQ